MRESCGSHEVNLVNPLIQTDVCSLCVVIQGDRIHNVPDSDTVKARSRDATASDATHRFCWYM